MASMHQRTLEIPTRGRGLIDVTRTGEIVPITDGHLALGTWQAIYLWEHRSAPHTRRLVVTVLG